MIFNTTSFVDDRLQRIAEEIEQNEVGLRAVCGSIFKIPCVKLTVDVSVDEPRRFNVLEDFVLRAADELNPPVFSTDLAAIFGLDPIFISTTCQELGKYNLIANIHSGLVSLTDIGREYYQKGFVPKPAEVREVNLVYTVLHGKVFVSDKLPETKQTDRLLPGLMISPDIEEIAKSTVSLQSVTEAVINAGLGWHAPEAGKSITGLGEIKFSLQTDYGVGVLILQDTAAVIEGDISAVSIRAYDLHTRQRDPVIEQYLQAKQIQNDSFLLEILPPDGSEEIFNELVEPKKPDFEHSYQKNMIDLYRERVLRERKKKEAVTAQQGEIETVPPPEEKGIVEYLWGDKIRPRFIQSMKQTTHTLMIMSPWITEEVVDKEFLGFLKDLAQKRVACVIGWGIAREMEREERIPSPELLSSLNSIQTPDGIPAVTVWWLGNFHNKECIIDYRLSLSGSQNWLSYRGDRSPRGESIYYVTFPGPIKQALDANEHLFVKAVRSVWNANVNSLVCNLIELERCCVAWAALRKPDMALKSIDQWISSKRSQNIYEIIRLIDVVYLTMARLPDNELSKIGFMPDVLEIESRLAGTTSNYLKIRNQSCLAWYLGRTAKINQAQLIDSVTKHPKLWMQIGLHKLKQDPNILITQLAKFAGDKKNYPAMNKQAMNKKNY